MKWYIDKDRPICPQIEDQICAAIALGNLVPGEKLKSVREVAVAAGVNPNTVQKAFSELERDGMIFSRIGSGWYVSEDTEGARRKLEQLLDTKTEDFLRQMILLGEDHESIIRRIREKSIGDNEGEEL